MVRRGFTRAYGTSLRRFIGLGTQNRVVGFLSGVGVTAILQSSTATSLLLSSFAKRGLIGTAAAMAVVIGADVGTTLVAQVLVFDLSFLMPLFLIVGVVMHKIYKDGGRKKHIARALIGIGLMLLSLQFLRDAAAPLKESPTLPLIIEPLTSEPFLGMIVAALTTWALHSSLAAVLLFASFVSADVLPVETGLVFILGANIGGAFVPVLTNLKAGAASLRIPATNFALRTACGIIALPLVGNAADPILHWTGEASFAIVFFHMAFNIALALLFLPFTGIIADFAHKLIPDRADKASPGTPQYLDEEALDTPVVALAGAARETLRMAEMVERMLEHTIVTFETNNDSLIKDIHQTDDEVDMLYGAIKLYMTRLTHESLDPKESDRYIQILTFATNLEHIGDIIDKSLMSLARKKRPPR